MSAKLKVKRGTTEAWNSTDASIDKTLAPGQPGVEYLTDGNMRLKVGKQTEDGSATLWANLPYITPSVSIYRDESTEFTKGGKIVDSLTDLLAITKSSTASVANIKLTTTGAELSGVITLTSGSSTSPSSFYSTSVELGKSDTPWVKGHITDNYVQSNTYSNSMKVAYNSSTEALEFISL